MADKIDVIMFMLEYKIAGGFTFFGMNGCEINLIMVGCSGLGKSTNALDKIRNKYLNESLKLENETRLVIKIIPDKDSTILAFIETGIELTRADPINNLGTTVRSGTKASILESLGFRNNSPICRWAPDRERDQTREHTGSRAWLYHEKKGIYVINCLNIYELNFVKFINAFESAGVF